MTKQPSVFQTPEYTTRTLVGANVFFPEVGAILEITLSEEHKPDFSEIYIIELRKVLDALAWDDIQIHQRIYSRGLIVAIPTEFDLTYAGCKILEITLDIVLAKFNNLEPLVFMDEIAYLEEVISRERYITLRNIYQEAQRRSLNVFVDDGVISIGSGAGRFVATLDDIGFLDVPWDKIYEIPSVIVTGTNGKTTTVRLTGFISAFAGKSVGYCSTDWVMINDKVISEGDLSGPYGNQLVLTAPEVDVAVLEVARGGLIKRGIATSCVNGAVVINVTADHLGVNGIDSVEDLAEAKFLVHNSVSPTGHSIINLDDKLSLNFIAKIKSAKAFISQYLSESEILCFLTKDDYACYVENNAFYIFRNQQKNFIAQIDELALTYKGLAKHNIENVLVAICLSIELGRTYEEIRNGLLAFVNDESNQGRFNLFEIEKSRFIIDYGHNHASIKTILKFARDIANPTTKLTVLLGFSGDRKFMLADITQSVIDYQIDNVIIKRFNAYTRGTQEGEIAELLCSNLTKQGFNKENILAIVDNELEATNLTLTMIKDDNIFILFCQEDIPGVITILRDFAK